MLDDYLIPGIVDGDIVITAITDAGIERLCEIMEWIDEGDTIEDICIRLDMELIEFRIFFATCNLMGAVDAVRKAMEMVENDA